MATIRVTPHIAIDESELEERFVQASGPGGQNVNKVATAVQLRFDVHRSPSLPDDVRARLVTLAGRRLTKEGVLVLDGRQFRTQERNRADVRERLFALIRQASIPPARRHKTRVPYSAKKKRTDSKVTRGAIKRARARPSLDG
jgi:ribosome-associated protein